MEKTTRPFRYDLNQISYDYTVEVTNTFKGLDLVDRVPEELRMEVHNAVQEAVTKIILITFFAAKDGEAWYTQQNQEQKQTVA